MIKARLTSGEIQDLINRYNSDLKKLEFQIEDVKMTIAGLQKVMNDVVVREKTSFAKVKAKKTKTQVIKKAKKATPPAKTKAKIASKGKIKSTPKEKVKTTKSVKAGKKVVAKAAPKIKAKIASKVKTKILKAKKASTASSDAKGYKLSDWDNYVVQSINQSGKVRITSEIIDDVKNKMTSAGKKVSDEEVKNKVTRSLQKLVNRRGDLAKVSYQGKGFAYALPKWLGAKGKALPEFSR